jgi:hypothetical protein
MDDLLILKQNLDLAINPNAGPGEIKAQKHNDYATELINKQGKYVGLPFIAKNIYPGIATNGELYLNGSLNQGATTITWTTSKFNANGNDVAIVLERLTPGDLIHFKDFVGRSAYFVFKKFEEGEDFNGDTVYVIDVQAHPANVNYTYTTTEERICVIEVLKDSPKSIPYLTFQIFKGPTGDDPSRLQAGDVGVGWINSTTFIPFGLYLGGGDPQDINNWNTSPFDFA